SGRLLGMRGWLPSSSSVLPGCRMMNSSGSPSSSASKMARTSPSSTRANGSSNACRRWIISLCTSRTVMSGHHVESDQMAVILGDAVDVPGLAGHYERALAVEWLQQVALHTVRPHPLDAPFGRVEALDIEFDDYRHSLAQHRSRAREVLRSA